MMRRCTCVVMRLIVRQVRLNRFQMHLKAIQMHLKDFQVYLTSLCGGNISRYKSFPIPTL